jgi:hypothetical protein
LCGESSDCGCGCDVAPAKCGCDPSQCGCERGDQRPTPALGHRCLGPTRSAPREESSATRFLQIRDPRDIEVGAGISVRELAACFAATANPGYNIGTCIQVLFMARRINSLITELTTAGIFTQQDRKANGRADAFRHVYWSTLLSVQLGPELAKVYLDAHERVQTHGASKLAKTMDEFNNSLGMLFGGQLRAIGRQVSETDTRETIYYACINAALGYPLMGVHLRMVSNGRLVAVKPH